MPDLLLELGTEEIPASFVRRAMSDLQRLIEERLRAAGIPFEPGQRTLGTPRRIIVHFADLAETQPDQVKESRGPALGAAFDAEGKPTKALEGFCRGQGVTPAEVEQREGYVWVSKTLPGKPTRELLSEILPEAIKAIPFDKAMRWGSARMRFARPIRWILASLGGELVPFEIEAVASGLESRGHRFYAPEPFEARTYDALVNELIRRKVEPDPAEREKTIRENATILASGEVEFTDALVEENVFLTEWPTPIEGTFPESYLELPEPVLVTAMAKHERMFPVRGSDGKLLNKFIFIRNSGVDDDVRRGCEWVLNARFNDARFFYDEDRKTDLNGFLEKTSTIVFQEKLGTVRSRADRLEVLAEAVAAATPWPGVVDAEQAVERTYARQAGRYAKADLATGLVGELASLQGIVGGEYGRRMGLPDAVCFALAAQYDLAKCGDPAASVANRTALRLLIADQLDKLAGYLGIGLKPTGSADPFGLRRAVTLLIEAAWRWPGFPDLAPLLDKATEPLRVAVDTFQPDQVQSSFGEICSARYDALLSDIRYDVREAVLQPEVLTHPNRVRIAAKLMTELAEDKALVFTATRPTNIAGAARLKGEALPQSGSLAEIQVSHLQTEDDQALYQTLQSTSAEAAQLAQALGRGEEASVVGHLQALAEPVNRYLDKTMVMVEDPALRRTRLLLMAAAAERFLMVGDVSKLVIEGM